MWLKLIIGLGIVAALYGLSVIFDFLKRGIVFPDLKKIRHFKDPEGAIVFYRGVNVCNYAKHAPDRLPWHMSEDYAKLKDWGFNVVRLQVFWEAIEPYEGQYDETYLRGVVEHIKLLKAHGVKVIIDLHQDLYAQQFNGNGFPDWTIQDDGKSFKAQDPWFLSYLQPAVQACYKNFWRSNHLRNRYTLMVEKVADATGGLSNVLGIDLMNEPFPKLPWFRIFEKTRLAEFFHSIHLKLIFSGYKKFVFFEPWMATSSGIPSFLPVMDSMTPQGCYIPHYYAPFCHEKGKYGKFDRFLMKWAFRIRAQESLNFCSPMVLGEFGVSVDVEDRRELIRDFIDLIDRYKASYMWWSYDMRKHSSQGIIDNDKNPLPFLKDLVQIYPQRVAGEDPYFDRIDGEFFLTWRKTDIPGQTIVFVPDWYTYTIDTACPYEIKGNQIHFSNTHDMRSKVLIKYTEK